jgi:hypothetical protein
LAYPPLDYISFYLDELTNASVDLNDNDLVIEATGKRIPPELVRIQEYVNNYLYFNEDSPQIKSSSAIASGETILVAFDNKNTLLGDAQTGPFNGLILGDSANQDLFDQIIVKYTWLGDYNIDGVVDGLDYSVVDSNIDTVVSSGGIAGWLFGDGNLDGVVDATDYGLIDANYGKGGPLSPGTITAVPEPPSQTYALLLAWCVLLVLLHKNYCYHPRYRSDARVKY